MNLSPDFSEFIELLNEHEVEYLIVGGYAVILHGYPRYTGDMDFYIKKSKKNAEKVVNVLNEFGFASLELSSAEFLKPDMILQLGRPPLRIDIINSLSGVTFEECYNEHTIFNIDDLSLPVIGLKQLKKNKKASGRHRDLDDVEHL
jgi:hypothetical protein